LRQKFTIYRKSNPTTTAKQVSKSLLNTSTSAAQKSFQVLARHQSEANETNNRYINIMEAQQSINFIFANIRLRSRRMHRENLGHERLVETGKPDGYIRVAWGWILDYFIFVLSLIWGVFQPILLILVMLIIRIVLITVFTFLGFYILYEIITS
jgi:ABC-type multidrug transport system fused ATPase/permease subunit